MSHRLTRRRFFRDSALAGFSIYVVRGGFGAERSPNEKLNIACIGAGGKGEGEVNDSAGENLVAMCDVDDNRAGKIYKKYPDVKKYKDFRKMLDEMGKQIDAVTVSTPDHIHAPAAILAMSMGKHAFVQKPMTRTIWETRQLAEAARKYKVATQMGNQGTSNAGLRRAVEVIQGGVIGKVARLHVWTNRPIWPQGFDRPAGEDPVPEGLDWNLWLGPAPKRPYLNEHKSDPNKGTKVYLPFTWRGWYDFGTGAFGDMACHTLNMPYWGLKLCHPTAIQGKVSKLMPETYPSGSIVEYYIPEREGLPPVQFTWYDGNMKPNAAQLKLPEGEKVSGSGALVVGDKGMLYSDGDYGEKWHLLPKELDEAAKKVDQTIPRSPGHFREWVLACKGGKPAMSNFPDYSGLLNEIVVLGTIAQRVPDKRLEWNGKDLKFTNSPEATQLVKPEIPKGWWI